MCFLFIFLFSFHLLDYCSQFHVCIILLYYCINKKTTNSISKVCSPYLLYLQNHIRINLHPSSYPLPFGYALDRLVTVSYMHYCTSTSVLSTLSSSRGLTTSVGISHLEGGFTLRCLQRLSLPDLATLPCSWRNNRYTSGRSSPVLSY